ncbi:FUN14 family protein [Colletotrichum asianum]|uniref:FUN14 family protein n=1 Tax=Colletotrichum asianum TaxID=702518 RepID=A0A8H3W0Z5_9PEZI|nr:FUN14 family protein [Colletotrichum asianum]
MGRLFPLHFTGRHLVLPISTGIGITCALRSRRPPIRFDSDHAQKTSPAQRVRRQPRGGLSPEAMRQLSSGSMFGFGAGLLVGFLSHTLVLLAGLAIFAFYLANRYGIDLPQLLGLKERFNTVASNKPFRNSVFRLSFAATFTLAAFVRF